MTDIHIIPPSPFVHRYWWTTLMALPEGPSTPEFSGLQRMWGDPTINTLKADRASNAKGRGIYRSGSEDHLMFVLFENWAAMPDSKWVPSLLRACSVAVEGVVREIGWSYEYTQGGGSGKRTLDIVLRYVDEIGEGILVLEAKKPGNQSLEDKDIPSKSDYLDVPGFDGVTRKSLCLLIGATDQAAIASTLEGEPVLTWERLAGLQIEAAKALELQESIKRFMVGAIVHQYALYEILPDPLPYGWMPEQPTAEDVAARKIGQTGADRRYPYWKTVRQFDRA